MSSASDYEKLKSFVVFLFIGIFLIFTGQRSGLFTPKFIEGDGYKMSIPAGWVKNKEETRRFRSEEQLYETEVITYDTPEINPHTKEPEARLQIYTQKLTAALWIEDEWGEILASIQRAGFVILDKGEIKVDGQISNWVVFHDRKKTALFLEFYMATDNNTFYKIRYYGDPNGFSKHRREFEEAKETFKFKFNML